MRSAFALLLFCALAPAEDWALGTTQVAITGGVNAMSNRGPGVEPSIDVAAIVGLGRYVAATGGYAWNRLASYRDMYYIGGTWLEVSGAAIVQEMTAGLRVNVTNPSVATPYFVIAAGLARISVSGTVGVPWGALAGAPSLSISEIKPLAAAGGGVDVQIVGPLAFTLDLRLIRPTDMQWYARATGGVALRLR